MKKLMCLAFAVMAFMLVSSPEGTADDILAVFVDNEDIAKTESSGKSIHLCVAPDGRVYMSGTFRFVEIPIGPGEIKETKINIGSSPTPPPPPPEDFEKKVKAALSAVTDEGAKETASGLAKSYKIVTDSIDEGELTDHKQASDTIKVINMTVTIGKSGWDNYKRITEEYLSACDNISKCNELIKKATEELKIFTQ